MHILIIPPYPYLPNNGTIRGIFQQHQAYALRRAGHTVGILSPQLRSLRLLKNRLGGWPRGIEVDQDQGIPVYRYHGWHWLPAWFAGQTWLMKRAGLALYERYIAEQGRPDLIHAHNSLAAGILAAAIKKRKNQPYILTEHSSEYAREMIRSAQVPAIRTGFREAERRLVVSPSLGQILEQQIGEAVCPWEYVPNILDGLFEQTPLPALTGNGNDHHFRFLNVGTLMPVKGQADLIRAFAARFKDEPGVELRIGGEGPLHQELSKLIQELGLERQVTLLGYLDRQQVLTEMQQCDVYVQSSHYETFGVVIIEALACGKPVIATRCGGPEHIVRPEDGTLVPAHNPDRLGEAMVDMRQNINRYDPVVLREECIARFGEKAIVDRLTQVYQQILANN